MGSEVEVDDDGAAVDVASGRPALVITAVLAVVVILLVAVLATHAPAGERKEESPLIGKPAPAIVGTTLDGDEFDLASLRGRWVVVNFFATWCVPCIEEHPELAAFQAEHATGGDAALVSVLFADSVANASEFFEENGGGWPVVVDDEGAVGVDYGVARVPESFLVAPTGIVVQRLVGGVTAEQIDEVIAQLEAAAGEA